MVFSSWGDPIRRLFAFSLVAALSLTVPLYAERDQDEIDKDQEGIAEETSVVQEATSEESESEEVAEEVIVTGSRIRKVRLGLIAPMQVIEADISKEAGLLDAADILQQSTAASGVQVDLTFTGYILDDGPASATLNLRGLGPERTLVLVNGRRLAPAGVEGAPSNPDLNLIPGSLIDRYELLLDGASSIYGSNAIAGVGNIILRNDFDGLEVSTFLDHALHSQTSDTNLSVTWGKNFDRGFVGGAFAYALNAEVSADEAPFTGGCNRHFEVDEHGNLRHDDLYYAEVLGMRWDECGGIYSRGAFLASMVQVNGPGGVIYRTEGTTNGGWMNFSESHVFLGGQRFVVDTDDDGVADVSFRDYDSNGREGFRTIYPRFERKHLMAYGERTFEGDMNISPFFEFLWGQRKSQNNLGLTRLYPWVPPLNPFNVCNPDAEGGMDCGLARDELWTNPGLRETIINTFGCDPGPGGSCDLRSGPIGPRWVRPFVSVKGDRNIDEAVVSQARIVGGVKADLPFLERGSFSGWHGEIVTVYTTSTGEDEQAGIVGDRLRYALGEYNSQNTPCKHDNDRAAELTQFITDGCVPVNMFAPSLYPVGSQDWPGDFATQAERDYLFDVRRVDTDISHLLFEAHAAGSTFRLPAGRVKSGWGIELRRSAIDSIPNNVAEQGLLYNFYSDRGAVGDKTTREIFAEVEIPVLANVPFADSLIGNFSRRLTKDEFYASVSSWSRKFSWLPVESLLIRYTLGTSYRAPNMKNLFFRGYRQPASVWIQDPCLIPGAAFDYQAALNGEDYYVAQHDRRSAKVLVNCERAGVDPRKAHNYGRNWYRVEVSLGDATEIIEEKSKSQSWGFVWDQDVTDEFALSIGATYYEIDVDNTLIEPNPSFIMRDCYEAVGTEPRFCGRITREPDQGNPEFPRIEQINIAFLNRDNEQARGMDVHVQFKDTVTLFGTPPIQLGVNLVSHRLIERSSTYFGPGGVFRDSEENASNFGYQRWKHQMRIEASMYDDYRLSWTIRSLSPMDWDDEYLDSFNDTLGTVTFGYSDTCYGPPDDVLCRDHSHVARYYLHSASLSYSNDRLSIVGGVRNLFDRPAPQVDDSELYFTVNNTLVGWGYDLLGRSFFTSVVYKFGNGGD